MSSSSMRADAVITLKCMSAKTDEMRRRYVSSVNSTAAKNCAGKGPVRRQRHEGESCDLLLGTEAGAGRTHKGTTQRTFMATSCRASDGQVWNQSMVVQLTRPGYMRQRLRKLSPIGDMASTTCKLARTRSMKYRHSTSGTSSKPAANAGLRTASKIPGISSLAKRLGTTPDDRMLLMSSKNPSSLICVSLNKNTTFLFSHPACMYSFLMSSRNSNKR